MTSLDPKLFPVALEVEVSRYFEEMFTYSVVRVDDPSDRLRLEAGLIAALAVDPKPIPSERWLGHYSPVVAIQESGLWNRNHVHGLPVSSEDWALLCGLAS